MAMHLDLGTMISHQPPRLPPQPPTTPVQHHGTRSFPPTNDTRSPDPCYKTNTFCTNHAQHMASTQHESFYLTTSDVLRDAVHVIPHATTCRTLHMLQQAGHCTHIISNIPSDILIGTLVRVRSQIPARRPKPKGVVLAKIQTSRARKTGQHSCASKIQDPSSTHYGIMGPWNGTRDNTHACSVNSGTAMCSDTTVQLWYQREVTTFATA
ncbi:hypothetical protein EJ04DRAFT_593741 [Polyplosphaeria fusca]|uniref:Uncharacterized protein n=1 Tax=Polyplosphaeria fusca TaxID=682080 RepID=A0A9P4QLY0_9PLEO|nr:hypothetical protein EJ04DRAFT_593741 [Polyplosphaeria fusca]